MIFRQLKNIAVAALLLPTLSTFGQSNTSSPYSAYGLGLLRGDNLPQYRAIGGVSTGIRTLGGYNNINISNPASYSAIRLTTFDIGLNANRSMLQRGNEEEASGNFSLNHINFAMPLSRTSAFSFGLMPYSDMGYNYTAQQRVDTTLLSTNFYGEGGINKAYIGYGIQLGQYFSVGANVSYLFGRTNNVSSMSLPNDPFALRTVLEEKRDIKGFNYDFGLQFHTPVGTQSYLTIGYTNNIGSPLTSTLSNVVNRYAGENFADSISFSEDADYRITMPMRHRVGVSLAKNNRWLVGADAHLENWSDFRDGDRNPDFNNSYGVAVGGQWTPNINSIRYLSVMDYRLGLRYDKTYLNLNNTDIKDMAVSVGLGLPISARAGIQSFYKINLTAEFGRRGTLENSLIRENYINFNLSFLLNDRWFTRFRYD